MYILELRRRWPFETQVCSAKSGLLSSYDGHLVKLNCAWRKIPTLLEVSREAKRPLLFGRVILVSLSIFMKSQASSPFEARNSVHLSTCQKDERLSVQKRWSTMAFSRVSTGDSVNPSSCEMKYEPDTKEGRVSLQWLKCRLMFHLKDEGLTESPVETLEKAIVLHHFWTEGLTSF